MFRLLQIGVADVVYGSRFYGRSHRSLYFYHYLVNRTISALFNVLFDQMLSDLETCYKMFRRSVIEDVTFISDDFGIEVELSAAFARSKRWRIYECGISYYGRSYAEGKKIGWRDGLLALWYIVKFRLRARLAVYAAGAQQQDKKGCRMPTSSPIQSAILDGSGSLSFDCEAPVS